MRARRGDPLNKIADEVAHAAGSSASPLDWHAAASTLSETHDRRELQELQAIDGLAQEFRGRAKLAQDDTATMPPTWGRYVIRNRIGAGAFAEVYRAWDERLQREVALKLLSVCRPPAEDLAARLRADAALAARVVHPNVVVVYDADVHDGRPGICMELIRGATLAEIVERDGPFSAREAVAIGLALCRALAAVHTVGVIHCDVKAQNVMRARGGRIVLMDFGAASRVDGPEALTSASGYGTPLYTAPEVLAGRPAARMSDVYSLGVLLYFLVTGRMPVAAATIEDLRAAHATGQRQLCGELWREDCPDFAAVIERALAPESRRFRSAAEFERALSHCLRSGLVPAGRAWLRVAAPLLAVSALGYGITRYGDVARYRDLLPGVQARSSLAPVIIPVGAAWRYRKGTSAPPAGWNNLGFDDTDWEIGPTGIGYGDNDDKTVLSDMKHRYWSVYARTGFHVRRPFSVGRITLRLDYDDGYVAYLNGTEVSRAHMGSGPPAFDTPAALFREAGTAVEVDLSDFKRLLMAGDNVIAIEVHNQELGSSDLSLTPRLEIHYTHEPGCGIVDATDAPWHRIEFSPRGGTFTAQVDIVPHTDTDGGVSLSNGPQSRHAGLAATVRFGKSGFVEVADGVSYRSTGVRHQSGTQYRVRLSVDTTRQTYDVRLAQRGYREALVGTGLRFRVPAEHLDHWTIWADAQGLDYCDPGVN